MSVALGSANHIVVLNTAEFLIRRALAREDASPFLAHCSFNERDRARYISSLRSFLQGDSDRLQEAFRRWPLVTVWAFAAALSEFYGEDGHAVYAVLERTFAVEIAINDRNGISNAFRSTCRRYALCYDGFGRLVDDYLAQAGIVNSQLHHVATAFLAAERAFGPPSQDSTATLNAWEDHAADFLPFGINVPRMVLEVDQTAYYAFLFTRFRRNEAFRNAIEELFYEALKEAASSVSEAHGSSELVAKPSLVWTDSGLALSLPKVEGRLSVSVDEDSRKLRGGQRWLLPTPWPSRIHWRLSEHSGRIDVFPTTRHVLAFDTETGRLVAQIDSARSRECIVDARDVALAAAHPFSADDEDAFEMGLNAYALHRSLASKGAHVLIGTQTVSLRSKPKPRIWVESGAVAKGAMGPLLSGQSFLGIELGGLDTEALDLALHVGTQPEITVPLAVSTDAQHATQQLAQHVSGGDELVPLRAELRQRGSKRALVRYKARLWPGLRGLVDGLVFDSDKTPANYMSDYSLHARIDRGGRICLDTEAAYESATLAFRVGSERVAFEIPRPGVALSFADVDGRSVPLKIGETLIVREEDKGCSLAIRCPYSDAALTVRGRSEPQAFKRMSTRVLSLADLVTPAPREDIFVNAPELGPIPVVLARIVPAVAPKAMSIERRGLMLSLQMEMQANVDALRLSVEDENGGTEEHDCALTHRPVPGFTPPWLSADLDLKNAQRIRASIRRDDFRGPPTLASLSVRLSGSELFRPLRSTRGESYVVLLESGTAGVFRGGTDEENERKRFATLNAWMCRCVAKECWTCFGGPLTNRWTELGASLAGSREGLGHLLSHAHAPKQAGTPRSWLPLVHPLEIFHSLYGLPASTFYCLTADASEGSEHLALLAETAGMSIPEIHRACGMSLAFLMSFENFLDAERTGARLAGFDFFKYTHLFSELDTDPGARWFWRPGNELLGPAHYGAALGGLIERFFDAGLDEEGANDKRISAASGLAHAAYRLGEKPLPPPRGVEMTHDIFEFVPSFMSGFARSSRTGAAPEYFRSMAEGLDWEERRVIAAASFLVWLAPELLAFYLLLWELASEGRTT